MAEGGDSLASGVPIGLDFTTLTEEGIASLQRLCGAHWTDYNLHDPGVTILEQLVYGLTDLAYRTEFGVADYLTGDDGSIDYQQQALYPPAAIFAGQALTPNDYRRLLYDAVPALEEVWVRSLGNGLLAIDVAGNGHSQDAGERAALERAVRRHYAAHRGLCEDLAVQVTVLTPTPYYLSGEIDTCGERSASDVLAQVLFECGNYMSSGMAMHRLQDVVAEGMPPERAFEGPPMRHGYVTAGEAPPRVRRITISELIGIIQKIEGVSRVRGLAFRDAGHAAFDEVHCDTSKGYYPCLPFPPEAQWDWLQVQPFSGAGAAQGDATRRAKNRAIHAEAVYELKKLQFYRHAFRTEKVDPEAVFPAPAGRPRDLAAYYSVQHDFPAVYGIGQYGLPHSASEERKLQARQLKGYLFPFEQLMANYLQNLKNLPILFSTTAHGSASYFSQHLGNGSLPDIESLYLERDQDGGAALAQQDDFHGRKGRLYDYLLALYGERFPQTALRRFNSYHPFDTDGWLLEAKARLLRELVDLSGNRGMACDYLDGAGGQETAPRLQRRIAILLGMAPVEREGLAAVAWHAADTAPSAPRGRGPDWRPVSPLAGTAASEEAGLPAHAYRLALFQNGISLDNYAIAGEGAHSVLYCDGGADGWVELGRYPSRQAAAAAAHACARRFIALNKDAERLLVIEHILLRPHGAQPPLNNFFTARFSVVLPAWTARCTDPDFRLFVRDTVLEHCPAHLAPTVLWLAPDAMAQCERLRQAWRAALHTLHGAGADDQEQAQSVFNQAAGRLAGFLYRQAGRTP